MRSFNLAGEYAYATECNFATLSGLVLKKSSAKSEISRQRSICLRMLTVCANQKAEIDWGGDYHPNFGRVQRVLEDAEKNGGFESAMDRFVAGERA